MVKISAALSAEGVIAYHREEYAANYESYYSQDGRAHGVWFGKEAEAFGLAPGTPVSEEAFTRLANGQDPNSGHQLIAWRTPNEERAPSWIKNDAAWREHIESLVLDAIHDGREVLREHAGGAKLSRESLNGQKRGREESPEQGAAKVAPEYSHRQKMLLEMHAIALETYAANLAGEHGGGARSYIKERGIKPDTAKEFGLGLALEDGAQLAEKLRHYGPELMRESGLFVERGGEFVDRFRDRLMFPIENERGETIAFAGRNPPNQNGPKYLNSPETELYTKSEQLYNLHRASDRIGESGQAVVVEGYMDAIAAYQAGQRNVVAAGGTALTEAQAATLAERAKTAILHLDGDDAGKTAASKHVVTLLDAGMNVRALDLPDDPAAWIAANNAKEYRKQIREVAPLVSYLSDRAREKYDTADMYGRIDARKWIIAQLEHVQPQHRTAIAAELEAHLSVPKLTPGEMRTLDETPHNGEAALHATRVKQPAEHRAAWDITFSAPKTISLTALVGGGDDRITKAHDVAVTEGLAYFERAIQVKMGGLNAPQTTSRMAAAMFRHDTARPVDGYAAPQLHTHAVVFNMSMDSAGQHRALNPRELFYLQGAADAVYQNHLAVKLKAFGYELDYGKQLAVEVAGYSEQYRNAESPRTAQIESEKEKLGQYGPTADDNIARSTRAAKLNLSPEQVRAMHLTHAEQFGNQPQQVVKAARSHERATYSDTYRAAAANDAIAFAKSRLSERTTVMEWHEIDKDALRFGRGFITLPDVQQAFDAAKDRGEFKPAEHWRSHAPENRYTTPELEAKEREILNWMAAGRGRVGAIAGSISKDQFREEFRGHLNDGQKHLVWDLIHAQDRMVGVQGIAGSGKTRALATVRDFAERYGYEVRGVAATSGAVAELRAVGIQADTLAAHSLRSAEKQRGPRAYLLDEASLTDVHQMSEFLGRLKPADRVIVIGDTRQHGSLGAGRMFAELQDAGMQTFALKQIVRQRSEQYRDVVRDLSRGEIEVALKKLDDGARIHEFPEERKRREAIAFWYMRDPQHTLVVSPDNRSRLAISAAIREARSEAGQLVGAPYRTRALDARGDVTKEDLKFAGSYRVGDVVIYARASKAGMRKADQASVMSICRDSNVITVLRESDGKTFSYDPRRTGSTASLYEPTQREFAEGDRIQFTRALKREKIANRALGTIDRIDQAGNVSIRLDTGKAWRGNLEKMPHMDHGYVMTSYAAQGSTAERVLVHLDTDSPGTSRMVTQQLIYVAASRGREDVQLFTNDADELASALLRSEEKAQALAPEVVAKYRGQRMGV